MWAWVVPWCWLVLGGVEGVNGERIPDCTPVYLGAPTYTYSRCGIRQAVDTYTTPATIAKYGLIQNWDTSLVTDMSYVFYSCDLFCTSSPLRSFNANISAWDVGKVTTMYYSTYTLPPPSQRSGSFWQLFVPFFLLLCCTDLMFEQFSIHCSFLFQSVLRQRFQTIIVWWQMGIFDG